jgi:hypothetical protein
MKSARRTANRSQRMSRSRPPSIRRAAHSFLMPQGQTGVTISSTSVSGAISVDPTGPKRIVLTKERPGWPKMSASAVFDIDADEHSGSNMQGDFYYHQFNRSSRGVDIFGTINDPKQCDRSHWRRTPGFSDLAS